MDNEQIEISVDPKPAVQGVDQVNQKMSEMEQKATASIVSINRAFEQQGEIIVRTYDRGAAAQKRLYDSLDRQSSLYGKSGADKLIAEQEILQKRWTGNAEALDHVNRAYASMIQTQKQGDMAEQLDRAQAASRRAETGSIQFQRALRQVNEEHERTRAQINQNVAGIEKEAALYGKRGAERTALEREYAVQTLQARGAEEAQLNRVRAAYGQIIAAQEQEHSGMNAMVSTLAQLGAGYMALNAARSIVKEAIIEPTLTAAKADTYKIAVEAAGRSNQLSVPELRAQEAALKRLGIATIEARESLLRMETAQIDVAKATQLGRLAQNVAVIGLTNSSEAFERLIYGIQSGQVRVLRTLGINVEFQESYQKLAKSLGKTTLELTDNEKVQARVNAVLAVAPRFAGLYEEAMGSVGKQMTSLARYFQEAKIAVGEQFQPVLEKVVHTLIDLLKLVKDHPELGTTLALLATGGLAGIGARLLFGGTAGAAVGIAAAAGGYTYLTGKAADNAGVWMGQKLRGLAGFEEGESLDLNAIVAKYQREGAQATGGAVKKAADEASKSVFDKSFEQWLRGQGGDEAIKREIQKEEKALSNALEGGDRPGFLEHNARVTALREQLKESEALKSLEKQSVTKGLSPIEQIFANLDEFKSPGNRAKALGLDIREALQEEAKLGINIPGAAKALGVGLFGGDMTAGTNAAIAAIPNMLTSEDQKRQFEMANKSVKQQVENWDELKKENEKGQKDYATRLKEYINWRQETTRKEDEAQIQMVRDEGRRNARLLGIDVRPGQELGVAREELALRVQAAEKELEIKEAHAHLYDMDRERFVLQKEMQDASFEYETKVIELRKKQNEEIKHTTEGLLHTLFTDPAKFGSQLGETLKNAVLKPIEGGLAQVITDHIKPIIFGKDGESGIAGALRGIFGIHKTVDPVKGAIDGNTVSTAVRLDTIIRLLSGTGSSGSSAPAAPAATAGSSRFGSLLRTGGLAAALAIPGLATSIGGGAPAGEVSSIIRYLGGGEDSFSGIQGGDLWNLPLDNNPFGGPLGNILGPGGTPPFVASAGGTPTAVAQQGRGGVGNLAQMFHGANLQNMIGAGALTAGLGMYMSGIQKRSQASTIAGGATLGAGIGLMGGPIGAVGGAGIGLFTAGMERGGGIGVAETTAGGALFGLNVGGPIGAAIGAGVGLTAGLARMIFGGDDDVTHTKKLVKQIYGLSIDDNMAKQIIKVADSKYGHEISVAVRDPEVRNMLMLYAEATGKHFPLSATTPRAGVLGESGGQLYQMPGYQDGRAYTFNSSLPVLGGPVSGNWPGGGSSYVSLHLDGQAAADFMTGSYVTPSFVQGQFSAAQNASNGRVQNSATFQQPGLLTAL